MIVKVGNLSCLLRPFERLAGGNVRRTDFALESLQGKYIMGETDMSILPFANQYVSELVAYKPGKPIEETAREIGMAPEQIVKLASNENPVGPSPKAVKAMQEAAARVNIYPDGASFAIRTKLAAQFGVSFEQTAVGSGSSELIELLAHAFVKPGAEVIAADYSFTLYAIVTKLLNGTYISVPNKDKWSTDLKAIAAAITPATRLVFITNPTNPVGSMVGQAEIDAFMAEVPAHVTVVFDEAYLDFADEKVDTVKFVKAGRSVCVLRTFSKAYGLAGARIGFAVTTAEIADLLNKARSPFNVNSIIQAGVLAAMDDTEHLNLCVNVIKAGRKQYEEAFKAWGIEYVPSHTNFILAKVGSGSEVFRACLQQGVILRPMDGYGLTEYIRISIGTEAENKRCLDVLGEVLGKK